MSIQDRRLHARFEFSTLPLVFALQLQAEAEADRPLRIEAKNISLGGGKFVSNRRFALFSEVQFSLFGQADGQLLATVRGKVVRLEEIDTGFGERTYGMAMEFLAGTESLPAILNPPLP